MAFDATRNLWLILWANRDEYYNDVLSLSLSLRSPRPIRTSRCHFTRLYSILLDYCLISVDWYRSFDDQQGVHDYVVEQRSRFFLMVSSRRYQLHNTCARTREIFFFFFFFDPFARRIHMYASNKLTRVAVSISISAILFSIPDRVNEIFPFFFRRLPRKRIYKIICTCFARFLMKGLEA